MRPRYSGISLRINPILVILALLIGYQIYGIAGALLALPIATVIRQTVLYLRRHLVLEPWSTFGSGARRGRGRAMSGLRSGGRTAATLLPLVRRSLEPRVKMPS